MLKETLSFLTIFSAYIPALSGVISWRWLPRDLRLLTVFFLVVCFTETWAYSLAIQEKNNLFILFFVAVVEFAVYSLFFAMAGFWGRRINLILIGVIPVFVVLALYHGICVVGVTEYNSFVLVTESLWLFSLSGFVMLKQFAKDDFELKDAHPRVQVVIGVLIFFLVSFFLQVSYRLHIMAEGRFNHLWSLHPIVNTTANIIFARALYLCRTIKQK